MSVLSIFPLGQPLTPALTMYPLAVTLFPIMWAFSHRLPAGSLSTGTCLVLGVQMLMRRTGDFALTLLDTIVLDAIPSPEYLAMANSITFSISGVGRAVGPFIVSSFFAFSMTADSAMSVKRQLVWLVMVLICLPTVYVAQRMVNSESVGAAMSDEENHELLDRAELQGSAIDD